MTQFVAVDATTRRVVYAVGRRDPEGYVGAQDLRPFPRSGIVFYEWQQPIQLGKDTSVLCWGAEEGLYWEETASIADLRAAKSAEINKAREVANATYFEFQGKRIACDALSWKDILSANCEIALTQQMPDGWPGGWKTIDNSYVAIPDVPTWVLFIKAMVTRGTSHFNHSQQLKSRLAAAETPEQIAAIKWETPIVQP